MAPRGAKRSAAAPKVPRAAKAAKLTPEEEKLQAITEVLGSANLTANCRSMLIAVAPGCLLPPKEMRHQVQEHAIGLIGEAIAQVRVEKEATLALEGEKLKAAQERKAELEGKLASAEGDLASKAEVAASAKTALAEAQATLSESKQTFDEKQAAQRGAESARTAAEEASQAFAATVQEHFVAIEKGAWETDSTAQAHLDVLTPSLTSALIDAALVTSLGISGCKKASERSDFDSMVMEQVGRALREKEEFLRAEVDTHGPGVAACSVATAAAESQVEQAELRVQDLAISVGEKEASAKESESLLKAMAQELKESDTSLKAITQARDGLESELGCFLGNVAAFEALRDHTSKAAEAIAEGAAAEAAESGVAVSAGGA